MGTQMEGPAIESGEQLLTEKDGWKVGKHKY